MKTGDTSLYLQSFVITVPVFMRKCISGTCSKFWDGQHKSIFRLSGKICAGWEFGFEFVDCVNSSHQTFSGFVSYISNKYRRFCDGNKFMSVPTFINWWFGWASAMKIDFRKGCNSCDDQCKILACDATKIGIGKQFFLYFTYMPDCEIYNILFLCEQNMVFLILIVW